MAEFYWTGNREIERNYGGDEGGTFYGNGYYSRHVRDYDWGRTANWIIKTYDSPDSPVGYSYVAADRLPGETNDPATGVNSDEVFFTSLYNDWWGAWESESRGAIPYSLSSFILPTNACLFGGVTGASGDYNGTTWNNTSGTYDVYRIYVDSSYGDAVDPRATTSGGWGTPEGLLPGLTMGLFMLGNTSGTTFGSYTQGPSGGISFGGLAGLSGNSLGTLQLINRDGTTALFGVSAGMSGGASNATTIGTYGITGASAATESLYNAFRSAITAGTLKMHITNYTGSADTEFTIIQNVGGIEGNTRVSGTLIDGLTSLNAPTGSTFPAGITCGTGEFGTDSRFFAGGTGITAESVLKVKAKYIEHHSPLPVNLTDSRADRVSIYGAGQFNFTRGRINQLISRRDEYDYKRAVTSLSDLWYAPKTSTYLLNTVMGTNAGDGTVVVAGGTYFGSVDGQADMDVPATRPVTHIGTSGGMDTLTVRAFRKGLVQVLGDVATVNNYPEEPHLSGGTTHQGYVQLSREISDGTLSTITSVNLKAYNDENMIAGTRTNNILELNCGMTLSTLNIDAGLVRVGRDIRQRRITVVDGSISGLGKLQARNEYNPSYAGFKIGGDDFPSSSGATGGVTLPEGMLISDPRAEIEFSTGHYVMADFLGATSANEAFQKPGIPPVPPRFF